jgi:5-methylcytosine-specific restriction endonuclease McrA
MRKKASKHTGRQVFDCIVKDLNGNVLRIDKAPKIRKLKQATKNYIKGRDKSHCRYCHRHAPDGHCDHIYPFSMGGADSPDNLAWSCRYCNLRKSNKTTIKPVPLNVHIIRIKDSLFKLSISNKKII